MGDHIFVTTSGLQSLIARGACITHFGTHSVRPQKFSRPDVHGLTLGMEPRTAEATSM